MVDLVPKGWGEAEAGHGGEREDFGRRSLEMGPNKTDLRDERTDDPPPFR